MFLPLYERCAQVSSSVELLRFEIVQPPRKRAVSRFSPMGVTLARLAVVPCCCPRGVRHTAKHCIPVSNGALLQATPFELSALPHDGVKRQVSRRSQATAAVLRLLSVGVGIADAHATCEGQFTMSHNTR